MLTLARTGRIAGATIINNVALANELVQYIPVVLRFCWSDHDDPVQDFQYIACDPRIILQFGNEANIPNDTAHWLRQMMAADVFDRKVVIFNDSVGWTEDPVWIARYAALVYALQNGHFIGLHAYGNVTGGYHPMMAWDNPGDYRWFAGRDEHLYSLFPDVQPPLILTECGAGGYQLDAGIENWLRDIQAMKDRAATLPYLKSWHWWTTGGSGGYGFDRDCLDNWLTCLL